MQMTMRWFGPDEDKVSLEHIRQVPGVEGVVGALYDVAVGEVWPVDKIEKLVKQAHDAGLKMEVIESVNIHDDIKIGLPSRDRYIANYQQTIRNLAQSGVKVICYNFMPVFDWMKTDMNYVLPDGSMTMAFEKKDIDKSLEEVVKEVQKTRTALRCRAGSRSDWRRCRSCLQSIKMWTTRSCAKTWSTS